MASAGRVRSVVTGTVCKPCWDNWMRDNDERHRAHARLDCGAAWYVNANNVCMCGCRPVAAASNSSAASASDLSTGSSDDSGTSGGAE